MVGIDRLRLSGGPHSAHTQEVPIAIAYRVPAGRVDGNATPQANRLTGADQPLNRAPIAAEKPSVTTEIQWPPVMRGVRIHSPMLVVRPTFSDRNGGSCGPNRRRTTCGGIVVNPLAQFHWFSNVADSTESRHPLGYSRHKQRASAKRQRGDEPVERTYRPRSAHQEVRRRVASSSPSGPSSSRCSSR